MRWSRFFVVFALAASFSALPGTSEVIPPPSAAASVRTVAVGEVRITVPTKWDFRPLPSTSAVREGVQASRDLAQWTSLEERDFGLEAWWVDASRISVPTDYYYLAAEGPAMRGLPSGRICSRQEHTVLRNRAPLFDRTLQSPGDYVATASGTCWSRGRVMRWSSFVAAPGYGPVRRLGIPRSGLYFALVMVPETPHARQRADLLLSSVSFGGTPVSDFLRVAGGQAL